jgi:hypothetical protein
MGQIEGDLEKCVADGAGESLKVIALGRGELESGEVRPLPSVEVKKSITASNGARNISPK